MKPTFVLFGYGGVMPETHNCMINEMAVNRQYEVNYSLAGGDADIGRCRSMVTHRFLTMGPDSEVLCMIDHDITWNPGDLMSLAKDAVKLNAIVGGVVSKKGVGLGINSQMIDKSEYNLDDIGHPGHYSADRIATAFCAFPRTILEAVADSMEPLASGYTPVFMPAIWDGVYYSEDYAFCKRAQDLGFECLLSTEPVLGHIGQFTFTHKTAVMQNKAAEC